MMVENIRRIFIERYIDIILFTGKQSTVRLVKDAVCDHICCIYFGIQICNYIILSLEDII